MYLVVAKRSNVEFQRWHDPEKVSRSLKVTYLGHSGDGQRHGTENFSYIESRKMRPWVVYC